MEPGPPPAPQQLSTPIGPPPEEKLNIPPHPPQPERPPFTPQGDIRMVHPPRFVENLDPNDTEDEDDEFEMCVEKEEKSEPHSTRRITKRKVKITFKRQKFNHLPPLQREHIMNHIIDKLFQQI